MAQALDHLSRCADRFHLLAKDVDPRRGSLASCGFERFPDGVSHEQPVIQGVNRMTQGAHRAPLGVLACLAAFAAAGIALWLH